MKRLIYCTADQRLCFRYTDNTIPQLLISKVSSVTIQTNDVRPSRKAFEVIERRGLKFRIKVDTTYMDCTVHLAKIGIHLQFFLPY